MDAQVRKCEDGTRIELGSLLFNYYDRGPVRVVRLNDEDGWHEVMLYDLDQPDRRVRTVILNGTRMCSLESAVRYGHASQEQVERIYLFHQCPQCWDAPCKCGYLEPTALPA